MSKLKLGDIRDDKPVKLTIELPAQVHRNLTAYAEIARALPAKQRLAGVSLTPVDFRSKSETPNPSSNFIMRRLTAD